MWPGLIAGLALGSLATNIIWLLLVFRPAIKEARALRETAPDGARSVRGRGKGRHSAGFRARPQAQD